jgi:DNA-3-methyladenine glycosylase
MISGERLLRDFFIRDVLIVAPDLIGKNMVVKQPDGVYGRFPVTEVEAYRGTEDEACHASKGRTNRTEVMYHEGGRLYVYFIYGMYWMLNVVTGGENNPQAVLIRGVKNFEGPGKLTKTLGIDRSFYGEDLTISDRLWFEDIGFSPEIKSSKRIGISYASEFWQTRPWRFHM